MVEIQGTAPLSKFFFMNFFIFIFRKNIIILTFKQLLKNKSYSYFTNLKIKHLISVLDNKFFSGILLKNYKKKLLNKIKQKLKKKYINESILFHSNKINLLSVLFAKYGSDKGYINFNELTPYFYKARNYANFYSQLFDHCRENFKLVLECGIGSNNENFPSNMTRGGKPGASLRAWRDYFCNAEIYGADIDKQILFESKRIKTIYVDQTDSHSVKSMWDRINRNNFDLIIDDGLHNYAAGVTFFKNSFLYLRDGGLYIIEDVSNKYLDLIVENLKDFSPEVIVLETRLNIRTDNNLIIIRK